MNLPWLSSLCMYRVDRKPARHSFIGQQPRFASGFIRKGFILSSELLHDVELTQNYTGGFLARKLHLALVSWAVIFLARQTLSAVFKSGTKQRASRLKPHILVSFPVSTTHFYRMLTKLLQY